MSNRGKILVVLLVFLILISLSLTAATFYFFQKEKVKVDSMQGELEGLSTKQRIAEKRFEEANKLVAQLKNQLQELNDRNGLLNTELEAEKRSRQEAVREAERLKVLLTQKETTEQDLKDRLTQAQQEMEKMKGQLKVIENEKGELEKKLEQAKIGRVELGEIVVGQEAPLSADTAETKEVKQRKVSPLEGKILVINRDYDFVIINLGSRNGLKTNNQFSVYHQDKYIGDIKVEKVHDSMSSASFVSSDIKDKINEGDRVVSKDK